MLAPHARPRPIGSDQTKLVVLLYGWLYAPMPYSAPRLLKSCGAGKLPFWFSSDCAPLSLALDSVSELSIVTLLRSLHSYFSCSAL